MKCITTPPKNVTPLDTLEARHYEGENIDLLEQKKREASNSFEQK
jgi:hypothetical protein